jgi:hypothetical protein
MSSKDIEDKIVNKFRDIYIHFFDHSNLFNIAFPLV